MFPIVLRWLRGLTQKQWFSRHIDLYQVIKTIFRNFSPSFIKIQCSIWKLCPKMSIFGHFWPLIPPNPGLRIFTRKTKTSLFLFHCYTTLCQKSERSNARFSRKSVTDGRTNRRRWINRSHFCLRQGTKNCQSRQKLRFWPEIGQ